MKWASTTTKAPPFKSSNLKNNGPCLRQKIPITNFTRIFSTTANRQSEGKRNNNSARAKGTSKIALLINKLLDAAFRYA